MKLRLALALRLAAVLAVALVVLGVFVIRQTRADLVGQVDAQMRGALAGRSGDPQVPPRPVETPDGESRASAHLVVARDGRIVAAGPSGSQMSPDPLPALDVGWIRSQLDRPSGPGPGRTIAATGRPRYRIMAAARDDGNLDVEATPLTSLDANVSDLIRTLMVGSLSVLAGAALTAFAVLRRSLRPLGIMANAAARIADGDMTLDPGSPSPHPELHNLGAALDAMVGRLRASIDQRTIALREKDASEQRLRRFVSDASHELQTPITVVRGWAELHRHGGLTEPDALANAMARVETESARMGRLVDDLLTLARSDEQRQLRRQPVDVGPLCHDAVTDCHAIDNERPVRFVDHRPEPTQVLGDPDALRQVIDNLLTNSRRHTPASTPVTVTVNNVDGDTVITVTDEGPGFATGNLERVFDRFWRAEQSRTGYGNGDRPHGSGLGLAIVQAIVTAHDGTVTASNATSGGAVVTVLLPTERPSRNLFLTE